MNHEHEEEGDDEPISESGFITLAANLNRTKKPLYLKRGKGKAEAAVIQESYLDISSDFGGGWNGIDLSKKKTVVFSAASAAPGSNS